MAAAVAAMAIKWALDTLSSMLPATPSRLLISSSGQGHEYIRKLERTMHRINAALQDAEDHWNIRDEVSKLRLRELKQVAYDAQDIIEESEYSLTQLKLQASDGAMSGIKGLCSHKRKHEEVNKDNPTDAAIIHIPNELTARAREVRERFDEIIKNFADLRLSENDGERCLDIQSERHTTSSIIVECSIIGREQDKRNIVEMLFSSDSTSTNAVSVLAIVGMGGLGKTTLAQMVYNDQKVHDSFNLRAWVCVSEHFDFQNITRKVISSLTMERCHLTEFSDLQGALDDLWNNQPRFWESLCGPMRSTNTCTIIVTTRQMEVARIVQTSAAELVIVQGNCISRPRTQFPSRYS